MPRKKSTPPPSSGFLVRLYKVLPLAFVAFAVFNLWFVFSYVRRERVTIDGVHERVMAGVSNALYFVSFSLSNEVYSARLAISNEVQIMRARVLALSTPFHMSLSTNSPSSSVSSISVDSLPVGDVPAIYIVASDSPMIDLHGSYFGVGDDFGYGPIESISKMFVTCSGRRYRLSLSRPAVGMASFTRPQIKREENIDD